MATQTASIKPFWRDVQFGVAFIAAPIVWGAMLWIFPSNMVFGYALEKPIYFLMLVGLYPILEEFIFRGVLQGWLREHSWAIKCIGSFSIANLLTSLVFTSLHFLSHPPLAAAMVFIPSLVFGYFRDRTDPDATHGLAAPSVLHCWYNAGYFMIFGIAG